MSELKKISKNNTRWYKTNVRSYHRNQEKNGTYKNIFFNFVITQIVMGIVRNCIGIIKNMTNGILEKLCFVRLIDRRFTFSWNIGRSLIVFLDGFVVGRRKFIL